MNNINTFKSTLIISVYTDSSALKLILDSLLQQTVENFEVIVSEDGASEEIKKCLDNCNHKRLYIRHLSQKDDGFRKNISLNRAIMAASSQHLIFIDGDCVPHPAFVEAHQLYSHKGIACTGRRLELGEKISSRLRNNTLNLNRLTNRFFYLLSIYVLMIDNAKNIESGLYSKTLARLTKDREIRLLGCNFSCNKQDLIRINGFNEDYIAPGIGEDSDIDWRLVKAGVRIKNIKFSAIQYHLYHPRMYSVSQENISLFKKTKVSGNYRCANGLEHQAK
jgi:glycosyltransferase involved in cell wall biosynthesis